MTLPSLAPDAITYETSAAGVTTAVNGVTVEKSAPEFAGSCHLALLWMSAHQGSSDDYLAYFQEDPEWNDATPEFHAVTIAAAEKADTGSCE